MTSRPPARPRSLRQMFGDGVAQMLEAVERVLRRLELVGRGGGRGALDHGLGVGHEAADEGGRVVAQFGDPGQRDWQQQFQHHHPAEQLFVGWLHFVPRFHSRPRPVGDGGGRRWHPQAQDIGEVTR